MTICGACDILTSNGKYRQGMEIVMLEEYEKETTGEVDSITENRMMLNVGRLKNARILKGFGHILLVINLLLLFAALEAFFRPLPKDVSQIRCDEMKEGKTYFFSEITVLDAYGCVERNPFASNRYLANGTYRNLAPGEAAERFSGGIEEPSFLIRFKDGAGQTYYTGMSFSELTSFTDACEDYVLTPGKIKNGLLIYVGMVGYSIGEYAEYGLRTAYEYYSAEEPGELLTWEFHSEYDSQESLREDNREIGKYWLLAAGGFLPVVLFVYWMSSLYMRKIKNSLDENYREADKLADRIERRWILGRAGNTAFWVLLTVFVFLAILARFGIVMPEPLIWALIIGFFSSLFLYATYARRMYGLWKLADKAGIGRAEVAKDLENVEVQEDYIRCGREVLLVPGPYVLPLSQLKWVCYQAVSNRFDIVLSYQLVCGMRNGRMYKIGLEFKEECNLILVLLEKVRDERMPDLLLGATEENLSEYRKFKQGLRKKD